MSEYTLFVGVDIAARSATVAWGSQPSTIAKPVTIKQDRQGWQQLTDKLLTLSPDPERCLVVMEATGVYWMPMALFLYQAGFAVSVINPIRSRYFARMTLQLTKTDAVDARLLALLGMMLPPALWTPPPPVYHELQQRLAYRDALVEMRVQERNRLHALSHHSHPVPSLQQRLQQHLKQLSEQIRQLEAEIEQWLSSDHDWSQAAAFLQSIPGIGAQTAAWILTATLNFSTCHRPEEAVAFAGLAPHARQSGSSLHSYKAIGQGGHERLRRALYLAAIPAVRFNPIIRRFYERLLDQGKPKKVALCAAARKLLHIAWAVVTKAQLFDPNYAHLPAVTLDS